MQFVREYGILDQKLFNDIKSFVEKDSASFEESELYSSVAQKKFIDHKERVSVYKKIHSEALFSMMDKLISFINANEDFYQFMLFKNDITYIKYSKGGFFKTHEDYLSVTSNCIQEFTLILCIDSNCGGGETVLHINDYFEHKSKHSITNGYSLLFRKDIKHEGLKLNHGHKHILSMNLWGFNKNDHYNQQNVVVTFKNQNDKNNVCIIPLFNVLNLSNTALAMELMNYKLNINNKHSFVHYDEKTLCIDTFNVFKQIYNESYISIQQFNTYKDEILNYGFQYKNLLIDFGVKKEDMHSFAQNDNYNVFDGTPSFIYQYDDIDECEGGFEAIKKKKVIHNGEYQYDLWDIADPEQYRKKQLELENKVWNLGNHMENSQNTEIELKQLQEESMQQRMDKDDSRFNVDMLRNIDMYLCDNNEQLMYILDVIKTDKLQYVPFKIVFAEGMLYYGGGMWEHSPDALLMKPVWLSVGELDHILFYNRLGITGIRPDVMINLQQTLQDNGVLSNYDIMHRVITNSDAYYRGLRSEEKKVKERVDVTDEFVFDEDKHYRFMYRINDENRMVLNKRYYTHIIRKMKDMDLVNGVRKKLNEINYKFPQIKESVESNFCNEDVYGNFNLIISSGFVYVDLRDDDMAILKAKELLIIRKYLPESIANTIIDFVPFDD